MVSYVQPGYHWEKNSIIVSQFPNSKFVIVNNPPNVVGLFTKLSKRSEGAKYKFDKFLEILYATTPI